MADRSRSDVRGQSEVLGFVLVFSVVMLAIGLLMATGLAGLNNAQDVEEANNAVRASEILADNVDDVISGRSPQRGTELKLSGTQLTLGDPVTIEVSGEQVSDPSKNFSHTVTVHPLEYTAGDNTTLVYLGGAVIREERVGEVMLREPTLIFTTDEVVIPIVQMRAPGTAAIGGDTTVNVRTSLAEKQLLTSKSTPYQVRYSVTSEQPRAWERYFQRTPDASNVTRTGQTVSAEIETDRVYVTVSRINVSFD